MLKPSGSCVSAARTVPRTVICAVIRSTKPAVMPNIRNFRRENTTLDAHVAFGGSGRGGRAGPARPCRAARQALGVSGICGVRPLVLSSADALPHASPEVRLHLLDACARAFTPELRSALRPDGVVCGLL